MKIYGMNLWDSTQDIDSHLEGVTNTVDKFERIERQQLLSIFCDDMNFLEFEEGRVTHILNTQMITKIVKSSDIEILNGVLIELQQIKLKYGDI